MFFICEKSVLSDALSTVINAVTSKTPLPILKGILINSDNGSITLTTNNLDLGIESTIPAEVHENGAAVIGDARIFLEIIRKLPNDLITVEINDDMKATIRCRKSVYNVQCLNPEEFPELPGIKEKASFEIPSDNLKKIIRQTGYAVSQRLDKPTLMGSLFEIENGNLTVVSLDGYRMAIKREKINSDSNEKLIIDGKALSDVSRIIKDGDTPVSIKFSDKFVLFMIENTKIISRLIEGEFVNYEKIIPTDFKISLNMELSDILTCVERADPIVAVDIGKNPIKITIEDDTLSVDCMTSTGKVHDVIEIENVGESLTIGFNQRYIHEALAACECEKIIMQFNGSLNPCIVRPSEGEDFLFMVLPVKLSQ
ncbi:MAG: DNA polymerase III subunit beta [Clostridia bacterium]|nr:DNA polymerase III subunit beta [Clostridia bacterium]